MKRKYGLIGVGIIGLIIFIIIYVTYIERHLLRVTHVEVELPQANVALNGFKIIQISDTQLGDFYTLDDFEKVVNRCNRLKPDIVVFTGDLIDNIKYYKEDLKDVVILLDSMQSRYGKYSIYGNHDQGGGAHVAYAQIMKQSDFNLLVNETVQIDVGNTPIGITGLDDWLLGYPELDETLSQLNSELFNVLLVHEPDVADLACHYPVNLQLSGHSHGGQVRLPFWGALFTPEGAKKYTHGSYLLNDWFQVYVNTGLGNTMLPFRFFNVPEITLIELKAQ